MLKVEKKMCEDRGKEGMKRREEERIRDSKQSTQQFPHSSVGEAVI